ncbi:Cytochrome b [Linum perenne]
MDKISFYPYFVVKDLVGWVAFAIFFPIWIFYAPNHLFLYVCWLYLFLKVCMCVVQVFVRFTNESFGCFWQIAYY